MERFLSSWGLRMGSLSKSRCLVGYHLALFSGSVGAGAVFGGLFSVRAWDGCFFLREGLHWVMGGQQRFSVGRSRFLELIQGNWSLLQSLHALVVSMGVCACGKMIPKSFMDG
jgi:hypothetical protein